MLRIAELSVYTNIGASNYDFKGVKERSAFWHLLKMHA